MPLYDKTTAVDKDWHEIAAYTLERYGEDQLRKYTKELTKCLEDVAQGKGHYKEVKIKKHKVRVKHCHKHCVFGLIRNNRPMLIIAIFHERMDLMKRLKKRLR